LGGNGCAPRDRGANARDDRTRFLSDIFVRPSIGPVAGWLLAGLIGLVAFLTIVYAPGAFERASDLNEAIRHCFASEAPRSADAAARERFLQCVERANADAERADASGIIPVWAAFATIGIVTLLALIAGWEPVPARRIGPN
jgi:hypothetical protein